MDFFDLMNEAYEEVAKDGISYTSLINKNGPKVEFVKRGDKLFKESGEQIVGYDEHSLKGRLDLGFYAPIDSK